MEKVISEKGIFCKRTHNSFKPAPLGASHRRNQVVRPTRQSDEEDENPRIRDNVSWDDEEEVVRPTRQSDEEDENPRIRDNVSWDDEEDPEITDNVSWDSREQLVPIMRMIAKAKYDEDDVEVIFKNMYHDNKYIRRLPYDGELYIHLWDPTLESPAHMYLEYIEQHNIELELEQMLYEWDPVMGDNIPHPIPLVNCTVNRNNNEATISVHVKGRILNLCKITQQSEWKGYVEEEEEEKKHFNSMKELETIITEIIKEQMRIEETGR